MVICGSYMFEFNVSKDMNKTNETKKKVHTRTMINGEFQYVF